LTIKASTLEALILAKGGTSSNPPKYQLQLVFAQLLSLCHTAIVSMFTTVPEGSLNCVIDVLLDKLRNVYDFGVGDSISRVLGSKKSMVRKKDMV
jgi:uncharacterized heparinase superfamily protein